MLNQLVKENIAVMAKFPINSTVLIRGGLNGPRRFGYVVGYSANPHNEVTIDVVEPSSPENKRGLWHPTNLALPSEFGI